MSPRTGAVASAAAAAANTVAAAENAAAEPPQEEEAAADAKAPPAKRARKQYPKPPPVAPVDNSVQKQLKACSEPLEKLDKQAAEQPVDAESGCGTSGQGAGGEDDASAVVTPKKLQYPMSKNLHASSKYYGVAYHALTGKWRATWNATYIGVYVTEEEAAKARWEYGQKQAPLQVEVASTPITKMLVSKPPAETPSPLAPRSRRKAGDASPAQQAIAPADHAFAPASKTSVLQFFGAGRTAAEGQPAVAARLAAPPAAKSPVGSMFKQGAGKVTSASEKPSPLPPAAQPEQPDASSKPVAKPTARKSRAKPATTQQDLAGEPEAAVERTQEQQERMDRIEDATPEEEEAMPQWLCTFEAWMIARSMKESTIKTYRGSVRLLYEEDRKSPAGMATRQYWLLVSQSVKNSTGGHLRSSSVGLWSEFFCDHKGKGASLEPASDCPLYRVRGREEFKHRKPLPSPKQQPVQDADAHAAMDADAKDADLRVAAEADAKASLEVPEAVN